MKYYLKVMMEYSVFHGRSIRREYWYFVLFNTLFVIVAMLLDNLLGTNFKYDTNGVITSTHYGWIYSMYTCAAIVPSLSVLVRRLHDIGKSGWMVLIAFIPIIGAVWLLALLCLRSNDYDNEWGPNPNPQPLEEDIEEVDEIEDNEDIEEQLDLNETHVSEY